MRRRLRCLTKLHAALGADKVFHEQKIIVLVEVTMLKEHRNEELSVETRVTDSRFALSLQLQHAERSERN
jgi:hypothetical protein